MFKKMKTYIDKKFQIYEKIKLNKKYGILFWITGLSGSGKTRITKRIAKL